LIENVPTAAELRTVSLRLYFKAWADITEIVTEWGRYNTLSMPAWVLEKEHFYLETGEDSEKNNTVEWHEYIEAAQSDLQGIYTLIQQSQEIGLKARICEVSPFLLLKRTDIRPTEAGNSIWDFTDFPTIDASELVRVHNVFCSTLLSKEFQTHYDEIRRNRNKISHLGIYRQRIDPQLIIDIMQMQYAELYPGRRWMEDRLHFATLHRWADYADSEFNERSALFDELWQLLPGLSDAQFKWLMGHDREQQRLICHACVQDGLPGHDEPYGIDVPTAYRVGELLEARCVICDNTYPMKIGKCPSDDCACELLSADADSDGACMICGNSEDIVERRHEYERQMSVSKVRIVPIPDGSQQE
jgi:hypothetical protein